MKDLFGDEKKEKKDFADLFEASLKSSQKKYDRGQRIKGDILTIGKEEIFLSIESRDAVLFKKDLTAEQIAEFKVGDTIEVFILKPQSEVMIVSLKPSSKALSETLEDSLDLETPVEGVVVESVNGGYRVKVMHKLAFCPFSQMDFRSGQPEDYLGKKFDFIVTKYEEGGRNIVVSRRKALEANRLESEGQFLTSVQPGTALTGKVTRFEIFGAFVELEAGIEGLIHISEIAWAHIKHPSEALQIGQTITVKVLKVEEDQKGRLRISLSRKQAEGDPWESIEQEFRPGQVITGILRGKERFGYFIDLKAGIRGLLPKSALRESDLEKTLEKTALGEPVQVAIDRIDVAARKISLALPKGEEDGTWQEFSKNSTQMGTFGDQFKTLFKK